MPKPKFGVFLPFYAFKAKTPTQYYDKLKALVLECEGLGYDSVWLDDHLMYGDWPILEPFTTLATLSAQTCKIRIGIMVSCIAHRNPALLAKAAATLDVLSNGRLELGVGAGCQETEHTAYGFGFPKPSVRIERLGEALEVITRLWTQQKASFQGKHYTLKGAVCEPKPLQHPHPPITVGGTGEKTLKITAKYADRFDWGALPSVSAFKQKLGFLEKQCRAVGRDVTEIERSCWPGGEVLVAEGSKAVAELIAKHKPAGTPLKEFREGTLAGTPSECLRRLQVYREMGVTYFMLYFGDLPSVEGLRLFAEKVAAKLV